MPRLLLAIYHNVDCVKWITLFYLLSTAIQNNRINFMSNVFLLPNNPSVQSCAQLVSNHCTSLHSNDVKIWIHCDCLWRYSTIVCQILVQLNITSDTCYKLCATWQNKRCNWVPFQCHLMYAFDWNFLHIDFVYLQTSSVFMQSCSYYIALFCFIFVYHLYVCNLPGNRVQIAWTCCTHCTSTD